jgi:hypothetical protein
MSDDFDETDDNTRVFKDIEILRATVAHDHETILALRRQVLDLQDEVEVLRHQRDRARARVGWGQ